MNFSQVTVLLFINYYSMNFHNNFLIYYSTFERSANIEKKFLRIIVMIYVPCYLLFIIHTFITTVFNN